MLRMWMGSLSSVDNGCDVHAKGTCPRITVHDISLRFTLKAVAELKAIRHRNGTMEYRWYCG